jgi:beta-1,4-N-acetylglucosaminyltransferase
MACMFVYIFDHDHKINNEKIGKLRSIVHPIDIIIIPYLCVNKMDVFNPPLLPQSSSKPGEGPHQTARYKMLIYLMVIILIIISYIGYKVMFFARYNRAPLRAKKGSTLKTMVYFGSGGHTMEILRLLTMFDIPMYGKPVFVLSKSDTTSEGKIKDYKLKMEASATYRRIYRAREVKQSIVTTAISTFFSLIEAFKLVFAERPPLIICNGPGTCVPICLAARFFNVFGMFATKIVFVESFCRVQDLSLSGKLLYNTSDRFIVQWPQLTAKYKRAEYIGFIC